MNVWRITRRIHAATPLDGEGSRLYGSRWNHPGSPLASTSSSLSLAALEYLVHADPDVLPDDLVSVEVTIPQHIVAPAIDVSELPSAWRRYPAPSALVDIGDRWLRERKSLLLRVPSAIIAEESNILINPRHEQFGDLAVASIRSFALDTRLLKRR